MLTYVIIAGFGVGGYFGAKKGAEKIAIIMTAIAGLVLAGTEWGGGLATGLVELGGRIFTFVPADLTALVVMVLCLVLAWLAGDKFRSVWGVVFFALAFGLLGAGTELGSELAQGVVDTITKMAS